MARYLGAAGSGLVASGNDGASAKLNTGPGQDHADWVRRLEQTAKTELS